MDSCWGLLNIDNWESQRTPAVPLVHSRRGGSGCHKYVRGPKVRVNGPPETIISSVNLFQFAQVVLTHNVFICVLVFVFN